MFSVFHMRTLCISFSRTHTYRVLLHPSGCTPALIRSELNLPSDAKLHFTFLFYPVFLCCGSRLDNNKHLKRLCAPFVCVSWGRSKRSPSLCGIICSACQLRTKMCPASKRPKSNMIGKMFVSVWPAAPYISFT